MTPQVGELERDREKLADFSDNIIRPSKEKESAIDSRRSHRALEHDPEKLTDFSDKIMRQDKDRSIPAMTEKKSPSPRVRGEGGERLFPRAG